MAGYSEGSLKELQISPHHLFWSGTRRPIGTSGIPQGKTIRFSGWRREWTSGSAIDRGGPETRSLVAEYGNSVLGRQPLSLAGSPLTLTF